VFQFCARDKAVWLVPVLAAAVAACSPYAYVANGGSISIINTGNNTVVGSVSVTRIAGIAVNPADRTRVYFTELPTDRSPHGIVHVIDTRTNTLLTSFPIVTGDSELAAYALGIAVAPDGKRAYAAASLADWQNLVFAESYVAVIDTATNTVVDTIEVGNGPLGVAVSPNGSRVYVANNWDGTISVIDAASNAVVDTVAAANCATAVAVSPDGSRVYVTSGFTYNFCVTGWDDSVSVIDAATNALIDTVPVEDSPVGLVVTPDGSRVYVANWGSASVSVIDTASLSVFATIGVDSGPFGIDVVPAGSHVYVANGSGSVSVIDAATNVVVDTVTLTAQGTAIGRFIVVPQYPIAPGDGRGSLEQADSRLRLPQARTAYVRAGLARATYRKLASHHATELSRLLTLTPRSRRQEEALNRLRPQIPRLLEGQEVIVSAADLKELDAWVGKLSADGGRKLRADLEGLRMALRSPAILERSGIRIQ
jgi:YVTN family beta-propeller protein